MRRPPFIAILSVWFAIAAVFYVFMGAWSLTGDSSFESTGWFVDCLIFSVLHLIPIKGLWHGDDRWRRFAQKVSILDFTVFALTSLFWLYLTVVTSAVWSGSTAVFSVVLGLLTGLCVFLPTGFALYAFLQLRSPKIARFFSAG